MNLTLPVRRLCWKEFRQLAPLIALLAGIAAFLHLLFVFASVNFRMDGHISVFLGMPGLFAVGVGALLVGQERELRTIQWLSTLPISLSTLAVVKVLVGVAALLLVWLLSGLLMAVAVTGSGPIQSIFGVHTSAAEMSSWPLHTLYIALAGTALAWQFRSSLIALVCLLPVALVPFLISSLLAHMFGKTRSMVLLDSPPPAILLVVQTLCCIAAATWGMWAARRALGPTAAAKVTPTERERYVRQLELGPPLRPNSALLWQAYAQNKLLLLSGGAIGLLSVGVIAMGYEAESSIVLATVLTCVAACWLGVTTFQGDRLHNRVGFLADRGIGPRQVWWTRHALPLAIAILCGLTMCGMLVWAFASGREASSAVAITAGLGVLGAALAVYAFSQWASQLFSSPIVACVAAPAISLAGFGYLTFSAVNLGTPLWLLPLLVLIPLVLTLVLTSAWMDRRFDRAFWLKQVLGLSAFAIIPAIPLGIAWFTTPQMPAGVRQEIAAEVDAQALSLRAQPQELVLISSDKSFAGEEEYGLSGLAIDQDPQEPIALAPNQLTANALQSIQDQLANSNGPVKITTRVFDFLTFEMRRTREQLDDPSSQSTDASGDDLVQRYEDLLETSLTIVDRLRQSPRVLDQDHADLLEIELLLELRESANSTWRPTAIVSQVETVLADKSARDLARRRAVAASWAQFQAEFKRQSRPQFGGYEIPQSSSGSWLDELRQHRAVGRMVADLWRLADPSAADTQINTEQLRKNLSQFWWWTFPADYGLGPTGDYYRADDLSKYISRFQEKGPGQQWQAGWENAVSR